MSAREKAVNFCLHSLKTEPEKWSFDEYRAIHRTKKISIWIANSYYGLEIEMAGLKIGGVVVGGMFIPWRRRIFRAVEQAAFDRAIASRSAT